MAKYDTTQRAAPLPLRQPSTFPLHAGRRIIVTGAAGGLGSSIAGLLLSQGARVFAVDLRDDDVAAVLSNLGGQGRGAFGMALDIADEAAVASAVKRAADAMDGLDGLVNNAAIVLHADPLNVPRRDWLRQFEVNLFGAYDMARAVAAQMIASGTHGSIVNVSSEAGKKGHVDSMAYCASKAALISLTRTLAEALAPHDINVNCVCPGGMATPMLEEVARAYHRVTGEAPDAIFGKMTNDMLGRHCEPSEVAPIASFLLSDDAAMIRGQAINADAGGTPY